ncbi:hypothetical protein AGMMS50268_38490 [Spirochaetia bacterium]|nr:hypothetical protein AGMMS50268_38490 [Spirochaetia bacterium]
MNLGDYHHTACEIRALAKMMAQYTADFVPGEVGDVCYTITAMIRQKAEKLLEFFDCIEFLPDIKDGGWEKKLCQK